MQLQYDHARWIHARGFDAEVRVSSKVRCYLIYTGRFECPLDGENCLQRVEHGDTESRMLNLAERSLALHIKNTHKI